MSARTTKKALARSEARTRLALAMLDLRHTAHVDDFEAKVLDALGQHLLADHPPRSSAQAVLHAAAIAAVGARIVVEGAVPLLDAARAACSEGGLFKPTDAERVAKLRQHFEEAVAGAEPAAEVEPEKSPTMH